MANKVKQFDEEGREYMDGTPVAIPAKISQHDNEFDRLKRFMRSEQLARELDAQGFDTPDEADDFDVGDDFDPASPYEHDFDHMQLDLEDALDEPAEPVRQADPAEQTAAEEKPLSERAAEGITPPTSTPT